MADLIKKRESNLLPTFLIFIAVVGGYLYYAQTKTVSDFIPPPEIEEESLTRFRELTLDFTIFDTLTFSRLTVYGELPVDPGIRGKTNPFEL